MALILIASATAHTRCAMRRLECKSGMRLNHSPPALGTGAGTLRARFEKKVPRGMDNRLTMDTKLLTQ